LFSVVPQQKKKEKRKKITKKIDFDTNESNFFVRVKVQQEK